MPFSRILLNYSCAGFDRALLEFESAAVKLRSILEGQFTSLFFTETGHFSSAEIPQDNAGHGGESIDQYGSKPAGHEQPSRRGESRLVGLVRGQGWEGRGGG